MRSCGCQNFRKHNCGICSSYLVQDGRYDTMHTLSTNLNIQTKVPMNHTIMARPPLDISKSRILGILIGDDGGVDSGVWSFCVWSE